jgi:membrane protease YdiL (CAAX protease family)
MDDSQSGTTPIPQPISQPPYSSYPPPAQAEAPVASDYHSTSAISGSGRPNLIIWGAVAVLIIALLVVVYLIGDLTSFLSFGVLFLPPALLAALSYAGKKNATAMVFAYIVLVLMGAGMILYSLAGLLIGYVRDWDKFNAILSNQGQVSSSDLTGVFDPSAGGGLLLALLLNFVGILVAAAMLLRPVRVLVSKVVPIDPDNFVHKMALSILTLVLFASYIPLLVLGGTPPFLNLVSGSGGGTDSGTDIGGQSVGVDSLTLIYQFIWTIPAAFVIAGWPVARRFPEMLKRLGLVRPTVRQIGFGLAFGVVMAALSMFVVDPAITWLWQAMGWQTTNTAAFDQLLGGVVNPFGAVVIGVTAGLGEEIGVRGLLQPRIGLIASNLVFTGLHAFQYGVDGLLSVFIFGTILGLVRARSNTSTSAIVHGMYDFTLVMVTVFGWF